VTSGAQRNRLCRRIKDAPLGSKRCSEIGSPSIVLFGQGLNVKPQTAGNYISHLAAVVSIASPAWGPLDQNAMDDARKVMKRLGTTSKSAQRDRRPTLDELDLILTHFAGIRKRLSKPD